MYKFKAKVLISIKPSCNCGGFYHPGEIFTEYNLQTAKRYITKGWVEVLESPDDKSVEESKTVRETKEFKG